MQARSWLICIWPGLPRLWWRGDLRALLLAGIFAATVDLWLLANFVWPEFLTRTAANACGIAALTLWVFSCWEGRRWLRLWQAQSLDRGPEDLFIEAQREYLNRHWFETEHLLLEVIRKCERDVESQLLLATVYRHTGRIAEAKERLQRLERFEGAAKWAPEIRQERRLLERLEAAALATDDADGTGPVTMNAGTSQPRVQVATPG